MLCANCGEREATVVLVRPPPPEGAFVEHDGEPVVPRLCDQCAEPLLDWRTRELLDLHVEEEARAAARAAQDVASPELRGLLEAVAHEMVRVPPENSILKMAMEDLLTFLATPAGRTHANCRATSLFLARINPDDRLPDVAIAVLLDMAGPMRDTLFRPEVAQQSESTPEQLLKRVRGLKL